MASFHQMQDRTGLGVAPEQVVAIIESINNPNISVPGAGTSPTKAYIVGIRLPNGNFTVMLYMHLLDLGTSAIFAPDPQEVTLEGYPTVEADAIHFVESMGFMLDNLNFRARPAEEQQQLQQTLPLFFERPPAPTHTGGFQKPPSGQFHKPPSGQFAAPGTGFGQQPTTGGAPPPAIDAGAVASLSPQETAALAKLLSAF